MALAVFAENKPQAKVSMRNSIKKRSLLPPAQETVERAIYCEGLQKGLPKSEINFNR